MANKRLGAWAFLWRTYILSLLLLVACKLYADWVTTHNVVTVTKFSIKGVPDAWVVWIAVGVLPLLLGLLLLLARRFGIGAVFALVPITVLMLWSPVFAFLMPLALILYWLSRKYRKNSTVRTNLEP
jgi:hypothetical protein